MDSIQPTMKPVKTIQKFKCDFCKKRLVKSVMEIHEKRCFRNPKRFCDFCVNKGFTVEESDPINCPGCTQKLPCPYCEKFDKKILKEIEEREKSEQPNDVGVGDINKNDIPF